MAFANSARACWPDWRRRSMFIVVGFCSTMVLPSSIGDTDRGQNTLSTIL